MYTMDSKLLQAAATQAHMWALRLLPRVGQVGTACSTAGTRAGAFTSGTEMRSNFKNPTCQPCYIYKTVSIHIAK